MELELLSNKKKRHPLRYFVLGAVFVIFMIYMFITIAHNNSLIKEKQQELDLINYNIEIKNIAIASLKNESEYNGNYSDPGYLEDVVRRAHKVLDYVRPGEIVFVITAGN